MKTKAAHPLPFALNDANFLQRLRLAAESSARIVITGHAKTRMRKRNITTGQIVKCLQKGIVSVPAHLTPCGDWKATVTHRNAGDNISVAVALEKRDNEDYCIVVTVMK